jgi:hypothetical protein
MTLHSKGLASYMDGFRMAGRYMWGHTRQEVGFEVLTVVNTKVAVFWVVSPCRLV